MLVETYSTVLTRAAWLYLGDAHLAEDAAQETLLAAWDAVKRKRPGASVRAWLLGILANRCRKHIRAAQRRRKREQLAERDAVAGAETASGTERLEALQEALLGLDSPHREALILRYWQGLSVDETAAALGVPAGTVKSRCHAAITQLRETMRAET
jgi:RNA polymerase sigma-70 factor (ECF subfamily)